MLNWFLKASGLTYKKTLAAREQKRQDVAEARAAWREAQKTLDHPRLVFIDETWASTAIDALWAAIADALALFSSQECANNFFNSGYQPIRETL